MGISGLRRAGNTTTVPDAPQLPITGSVSPRPARRGLPAVGCGEPSGGTCEARPGGHACRCHRHRSAGARRSGRRVLHAHHGGRPGSSRPHHARNSPALSSAPVWVAADRDYFERHGLNVTLQEYDTGLSAVTGVQHGEADIALSAEFALVQKAFGNGDLCGIGSVARSELMYLVGRRDRGVVNVSDIWGKRIGVPRHTISEFYLSRFVALQGLSLDGVTLDDVTLVDVSRSDGVEALCNGSVDAVVTAERYLSAIRGSAGRRRVGPARAERPVYVRRPRRSRGLARGPSFGGRPVSAGGSGGRGLATGPPGGRTADPAGPAGHGRAGAGGGVTPAPVLALARPVAHPRHGGRGALDNQE